jgi:hypothetical protein
VIYLSDVPELLEDQFLQDPDKKKHYLEVARLAAPPPERPGSFESGRFGMFQKYVSPGHLDFSNGLWLEFELEGWSVIPAGGGGATEIGTMDENSSTVLLDDWGPLVMCDAVCMDLDYDAVPTEGDFLFVIGSCGLTAGLEAGEDATACLDGFFSTDGFVDTFDLISWDWALSSGDMFVTECNVPLTGSSGQMSDGEGGGDLDPIEELDASLSDLLILGKRKSVSSSPLGLKLKDGLYVFDDEGDNLGCYAPEPDRCGIRLVQDTEGGLYQLNTENGMLQLYDPNEVIIPPGSVGVESEPRYNTTATVYVCVQGDGEGATGRPILDAAFDEEYVYVVPVVVQPTNTSLSPYTAAAKLELLDLGNPPYAVVQIYDDPPPPGDNQNRNNVREIEVDSAGNVYVLNVHRANEADTLWRYDPNGEIVSISLGNPSSPEYLPDPIGLYVSDTTDMVYAARGQYNPEDIYSTSVYGFSRNNLSLERTITINGIQHVTGITEEPKTGTLWVLGFNMDEIPDWPLPGDPTFYDPYLAKIPYDSSTVDAVSILNDSHDLAMPLSILWTKGEECGGADINGDGEVTFADFAELGSAWLTEIGDANWNGICNIGTPPDGYIDAKELATLTEHWLESGCLGGE